nr:calcium-binding protein [Hydrogenophaga sp.]
MFIMRDAPAGVGKYNVLQFKAGIAPGDVVVTRSDDALVLGIAGSTDKVTVAYFFYQGDPGNNYNPIQAVKFADGTVWNTAQIVSQLPVYANSSATLGNEQKDLVLTGSTNASGTGNALNNNLTGNTGSNVLLGLAGGALRTQAVGQGQAATGGVDGVLGGCGRPSPQPRILGQPMGRGGGQAQGDRSARAERGAGRCGADHAAQAGVLRSGWGAPRCSGSGARVDIEPGRLAGLAKLQHHRLHGSFVGGVDASVVRHHAVVMAFTGLL